MGSGTKKANLACNFQATIKYYWFMSILTLVKRTNSSWLIMISLTLAKWLTNFVHLHPCRCINFFLLKHDCCCSVGRMLKRSNIIIVKKNSNFFMESECTFQQWSITRGNDSFLINHDWTYSTGRPGSTKDITTIVKPKPGTYSGFGI